MLSSVRCPSTKTLSTLESPDAKVELAMSNDCQGVSMEAVVLMTADPVVYDKVSWPSPPPPMQPSGCIVQFKVKISIPLAPPTPTTSQYATGVNAVAKVIDGSGNSTPSSDIPMNKVVNPDPFNTDPWWTSGDAQVYVPMGSTLKVFVKRTVMTNDGTPSPEVSVPVC